jgi:hypothetical protein
MSDPSKPSNQKWMASITVRQPVSQCGDGGGGAAAAAAAAACHALPSAATYFHARVSW